MKKDAAYLQLTRLMLFVEETSDVESVDNLPIEYKFESMQISGICDNLQSYVLKSGDLNFIEAASMLKMPFDDGSNVVKRILRFMQFIDNSKPKTLTKDYASTIDNAYRAINVFNEIIGILPKLENVFDDEHFFMGQEIVDKVKTVDELKIFFKDFEDNKFPDFKKYIYCLPEDKRATIFNTILKRLLCSYENVKKIAPIYSIKNETENVRGLFLIALEAIIMDILELSLKLNINNLDEFELDFLKRGFKKIQIEDGYKTQPIPQTPDPTPEPQPLPDALNTDHAKKYFQKAVEVGLIEQTETGYKWKETKQLLAYFAERLSEKLNLINGLDANGNKKTAWKPFEVLFDVKDLKGAKQNWMRLNTKFEPTGFEKVDALI